MHKLLIAVESEELRDALTQALGSDYVVKVCADGQQTRSALEEFQPDLWVLDLTMPLVDGITLLHHADKIGCHPVKLVILSHESSYIMNALCRYEVAYLMKKPCYVDALAEQIQALAATVPTTQRPSHHPAIGVSAVLLELGFSPKVDGFGYLTAAIPLLMADAQQSITKELYTAVGHPYHKSGTQVERCIRTAISSAWQNGDRKVWQCYFPVAPDGSVPRPSNGKFLSHIALALEDRTAQRGA